MRVRAKLAEQTGQFSDWLLDKFSASKLGCFTTCPRKAFYKYIAKVKEPFGLHFVYGKAVHEGQEADAYAKVRGKMLKLAEVHEVAVETFKTAKKEAGEEAIAASVDDFASDHARQLEVFESSGERARVLPVPGTIEAQFQVELDLAGGRPALLEGYTDVVSLDEQGRKVVLDYKTAGRPVSAAEAAEHMQLALEALGAEAEAGRIVTFVKHAKQKPTTKVTPDVEIRQDAVDSALVQVGEAIAGFRVAHERDFWPKRAKGSMECSYCSFYSQCWPSGPGAAKSIVVTTIRPAGSLPVAEWRESKTGRQERQST